MNATLEFTEAVSIVIFAAAAECITTGCTGGEAFLFTAHLLAVRACLQAGAISTPPARIIIAVNILAVRLLATNTARNDLAPLAGLNGQLVQVVVVLLAVAAHCRIAYIADMHLRFTCFETVGAARAGLPRVMARCCMKKVISIYMGQWEVYDGI